MDVEHTAVHSKAQFKLITLMVYETESWRASNACDKRKQIIPSIALRFHSIYAMFETSWNKVKQTISPCKAAPFNELLFRSGVLYRFGRSADETVCYSQTRSGYFG